MAADGRPFRSAYDADVLDGQDGEEQILVGAIIPVLVHVGVEKCSLTWDLLPPTQACSGAAVSMAQVPNAGRATR